MTKSPAAPRRPGPHGAAPAGDGASSRRPHWPPDPIHYLDDAIRAKTIKPMIVVYASAGQRTYYTDNPAINVRPETAIAARPARVANGKLSTILRDWRERRDSPKSIPPQFQAIEFAAT